MILMVCKSFRLKFGALAAVLCAVHPLSAQTTAAWTSNGSVLSTPAGSEVVIGASSPASAANLQTVGLTVQGSIPVFHFDDWGNDTVVFQGQKSTSGLYGEYAIRTQYSGLIFRNTQTNALMLFLGQTGNVGIGTAAPQHLLHVAGTIGAEEVVVSPTGADYVFDTSYRLAPLSEVADYIKANHHLPEIPSAAEGKEKGVGIGEMQSKLLAKIEELTLNMIAAEEKNSDLEKDNRAMRERIEQLEKRVGK